MRVTLTVIEGVHKGRVFNFAEHDTFIVGRSKRAHFQLSVKDQYFSRNHFLVEVNPPHCRLLDLGSRNGTYINGVRITSADLNDGDIVKAGRTVIRASIQKTVDRPIVQAQSVQASRPGQMPSKVKTAPLASPVLTVSYVASRRESGRSLPSSRKCPACDVPMVNAPSHPPLCDACAAAALQRPQPITGFLLVREIGRGAMGVVELAVRLADGAPVAVKTIIPANEATPADVTRFLREASILRALDHPHIVAFREMGESNQRFFFVMDYIRGENAGKLLKMFPDGMPIKLGVELVCQLLGALDYAHAKQFVHRDIKPGNLLVEDSQDGGPIRPVVRLADFGLARMYHASSFSGLTMKGDYGGTFPFMAPEQITNYRESLPTNDLYSAGATLYNLLTGRYVYDFPPPIQLKVLMLLQDEVIPIRSRRSDIPAGLAEIIHRSLARDPTERFANAREMKEALLPFRN